MISRTNSCLSSRRNASNSDTSFAVAALIPKSYRPAGSCQALNETNRARMGSSHAKTKRPPRGQTMAHAYEPRPEVTYFAFFPCAAILFVPLALEANRFKEAFNLYLGVIICYWLGLEAYLRFSCN
jgi:hypothetical protein